MDKRIWLALCAAATMVLQGCATTQKTLSRDEWIATTARIYSGVTREKALVAAERVLMLADGDDFRVVHSDEGFEAVRDWMAFVVIVLVIGKDFWTVRVADTPEGVKVVVQVRIWAEGMGPQPTTTKGTWTTASSTSSGSGHIVDGPALYGLFFSRMDYLLGLRQNWPTCEEADADVDGGVTWGNNKALCNSFNITDAKPDGPL